MKVLHLNSNRWNSAITEYALSATNSLVLYGFQNIYCPLAGSPGEKRAIENQLQVKSFNSFSLAELGLLYEIITSFQPHVIICYGGRESTLVQALFGLRLIKNGIKIVRFRGQDFVEAGHQWKYRFGILFVDLILTPSINLKKKHEAFSSKKNIETLILGCNTKKYRFFGIEEKKARPQIVLLGRLDPVKGHNNALSIFKHLVGLWEPTWGLLPLLHIIGEPANLTNQDIVASIKKSGLQLGDHVLLTTKRVTKIEEVMSKASVGFVSSIASEVICRVAEEFLLCGTPVFVSGVGSLNEVLVDPLFGESYLGDHHKGAAEKLIKIVRESMAEDAAEKEERSRRARKFFSWEVMGQSLGQMLERIV